MEDIRTGGAGKAGSVESGDGRVECCPRKNPATRERVIRRMRRREVW